MAVIGNLAAELSAGTASWERDLGKAERQLRSSQAKMNRSLGLLDKGFARSTDKLGRMVKGMFSLRGMAATLVGGAGLGLLVKKSLDFADSIAKTADVAGISTAALQEYRFAAGIAGVGTDQLDKAVTQLGKRIGELGKSSSELETTLKDLSPALLEDLRAAKSVEDQFVILLRTLGNTESQTKKLALANAAFGRSGLAMVNMVKNGVTEFERLRRQANDLGLVIDDKLLRNAERAKDQLSILGQVLKINVTTAVLENAAAIADLADILTKGAIGFGKITIEALKFWGAMDRSRQERITALKNKIDDVQASWLALRMAQKKKFMPELVVEVDRLSVKLDDLNAQLERLQRPIHAPKVAAAPARPGAATEAATTTAFEPPAPREKPLDEHIKRQDERLKAVLATIDAEETARRDFLGRTHENFLSATGDDIRLIELRRDRTLAALEKTKASEAQAARARVEISRTAAIELKAVEDQRAVDFAAAQERNLEASRKFADGAKRAFQSYADEATNRAANIENTISSGLRKVEDAFIKLAQTGKLSFKELADSIIADLIRIQVREQITGPVSGFLSGLFSGGFSFPSGGGLGKGVSPTGSNIVGTPFARGGIAPAGQPAIVGEKGPELIMPGRTSRIIPNDALGGNTIPSSDGSITNNHFMVDMRGADKDAVLELRAFVRDMDATLEQRAVRAVRGARAADPRLFG